MYELPAAQTWSKIVLESIIFIRSVSLTRFSSTIKFQPTIIIWRQGNDNFGTSSTIMKSCITYTIVFYHENDLSDELNSWIRILHAWFMIPVIQWPVECEQTKCPIDTSWYFKVLMSISIRISIQGRMVIQQRWLEVLQEIHVVQSLPSTWIVTWMRHVSLPEQRFHLQTIQVNFQDWKPNWFHWIMDPKYQNVIKRTIN